MVAGSALYRDTCAGCHKLDGSGVPYLFPNLAASAAVASREPTSILQVVLNGTRTVGTPEEPTAPGMPSYGWQLDDEEVAAVATFVRNSWGHASSAVSASDVRRARGSLLAQGRNR